MLKEIEILEAGYDDIDAMRAILRTDKNVRVVEAKPVYYPYKLIKYSVSAGGRRRAKLDMKSICIVDMVTGRPAEGSGIPEFITEEVEEEVVLAEKIDRDRTTQIGHDFVLKLYISQVKMLSRPRIEELESKYFYKKFYIVRCLDEEDLSYYIMVDAIDGDLVILDDK